MESRNNEIIKTSIVIGGNVGNLGAVAGYVISGVWGWGEGFCRQFVPDSVASSALLNTCIDALSPKYLAPIGYVAGAAVGFTTAAAYLYLQEPVSSKKSNAESIEDHSIAAHPASFFSEQSRVEKASKGSLQSLRTTYSKSMNLKKLLEEGEQSRFSPVSKK